MMTFIIFNIFILTLWVHGFQKLQDRGMLLGGLREWHDGYFDFENSTWTKYNLHWISKPLYSCIYCTCSVHGFLVYSIIRHILNVQFSIYNLILICVCTVNVICFTSKYND